MSAKVFIAYLVFTYFCTSPKTNLNSMKLTQTIITCLFVCNIYAQVGIGTTAPSAELDINAISVGGIPPLELNPQTTPTGTASGQIAVIGDELYLYDASRTKWLSVASSTFNFGKEGSLNNTDLEYAGDIDNSGPSMAQAGTIVYVSLNSSGGNQSKGFTLSRYNTANTLVSTNTFTLHTGELVVNDANIDFNKGDYFIVSVDACSGGNVDDASMVLWTKWRQ